MKTSISILICKMVTLACHIFKRDGSVFPGSMALKVSKQVLKKVYYPDKVIVVTGSSGKGSTVAMVAHILEKNGKKVVWNKNGSNTRNAMTSLILNNTGLFSHRLKGDILLLEMDERFIAGTFAPGTITHMAITNITRDQPARNIHPSVIYEKITNAIDKHMNLIINADDPLLNRIKYSTEARVITYGVAKTKYDTLTVPNYAVDFAYCPSCQSKLKYSSYHYGDLGLYECPRCNFKRGKIDYEATKISIENSEFYIGKDKLFLNKKVFFAIYYTLLAYAICSEIGLAKEDILKEINLDSMTSKRGKTYTLDNRKIEMLESKNENSLSYLQSLNYIKSQDGIKTVIMGFENVSRRYHFNDLSWLWDVNFELLNDETIDRIFLVGRFKYDIAVRLEYAGIDETKIVLVDSMKNLLDDVVQKSKGSIYTMVCFDMTEIILNLLKERKDEKDN